MKTRRLIAAAIVTAALVLTGCGRADTAAVVDGHVITESGVLEVSDQIAEYATSPLAPRDIVNRLVVLPPVLEVLGERGVTISDAAARSAVSGIADPSPYLLDLARLDLAIGQLTPEDQQNVIARLQEIDVEVNPRYGSFDPQQAAVVASDPDWIVGSADTR